MNRVILIGNLTKDPELKYTPNGIAVCNFTIAVNRPRNSYDNEQQADFIHIIAWQKLADICANYLTKGREAAVEGRLHTRSYEKDGRRVYVTEVVAERVDFLGARPVESYPQGT